MYESTPQHIIDEESAPGPVAAWMDSSSSEDDTSSGSDTDGSSASNTTAGRIRRVMRRRRRRRSSGSRDTDVPAPTRTPSYATSNTSPTIPDAVTEEPLMSTSGVSGHRFGAIEITADVDDDMVRSRKNRAQNFNEKTEIKSKKEKKHKKKHHKKKRVVEKADGDNQNEKAGEPASDAYNEPRRVDFAVTDPETRIVESSQKKSFTLRGISMRPAIPKTFSQNVFTQPGPSGSPHLQEPPVVTGPIPHVRYGIRRTNSLPGRLNQVSSATPSNLPPASLHTRLSNPVIHMPETHEEINISRTTAVVLLLMSTGLVALCANFMVDAIGSVTTNTSLGATFVGLILLPIVGNAAEHVTAVTVARKNKMDLAIGVAVGSSIQIGMFSQSLLFGRLRADRNLIALFITPFIVLLGWCMGKPMTLYFTLFETVSLFVSVFVVNFLVLDGRSNYLEGALLVAAYIIIAVAAFFYPGLQDQNSLGGGGAKMVRNLLGL
jgi:Ca2+:H+ antiporter